MTRRRALAALVTVLLFTGPAFAQDPKLVEAAKKEGKVVWYTSLVLPSAEKVAKLFETAYPGIKVEVHRTGSQRILQRVMQELTANIKIVDVIHTSDAGHFVLLKDKKLLMRYTPAGVDKFPAGFKDKENGKEVIVALRIRRGGETLLMRSRIGQTMWETAANHACLCQRGIQDRRRMSLGKNESIAFERIRIGWIESHCMEKRGGHQFRCGKA